MSVVFPFSRALSRASAGSTTDYLHGFFASRAETLFFDYYTFQTGRFFIPLFFQNLHTFRTSNGRLFFVV